MVKEDVTVEEYVKVLDSYAVQLRFRLIKNWYSRVVG